MQNILQWRGGGGGIVAPERFEKWGTIRDWEPDLMAGFPQRLSTENS